MISDPAFPLQFQLHIDDERVDACAVSIDTNGFQLQLLKVPRFPVSERIHKFNFELYDGRIVNREGQITRIEPVIFGPMLPIHVTMHVRTSLDGLEHGT